MKSTTCLDELHKPPPSEIGLDFPTVKNPFFKSKTSSTESPSFRLKFFLKKFGIEILPFESIFTKTDCKFLFLGISTSASRRFEKDAEMSRVCETRLSFWEKKGLILEEALWLDGLPLILLVKTLTYLHINRLFHLLVVRIISI